MYINVLQCCLLLYPERDPDTSVGLVHRSSALLDAAVVECKSKSTSMHRSFPAIQFCVASDAFRLAGV